MTLPDDLTEGEIFVKYLETAKNGMLVVIISGMSACTFGPSPERLAGANYGSDITTEDCRIIAEEAVANGMRYPNSAEFRNSTCTKGYWAAVPFFRMKRVFGWVQEGEVNGKNVFGGTGRFRPYKVLIRDDSVVRYCIRERAGGYCVPLEIKADGLRRI